MSIEDSEIPVSEDQTIPLSSENEPERRKSLRDKKPVSYTEFETEERVLQQIARKHEQHQKSAKSLSRNERDEESDDNIDNAIVELASDVGDSFPAVRLFFEDSLEKFLNGIGPSEKTRDVIKNWKVILLRRPGILSAGLIDVVYISQKGRKCRTRIDVAIAAKLLERPSKGIPRHHLHLAAIELRERNLISQQIISKGGSCTDIYYDGDNLFIKCQNRIG
jgi:hypothetical protein